MIQKNIFNQVQKKRIFEVIAVCSVSIFLIVLSRLEAHLFTLSESLSINKEFLTTLTYFALININVILILLLSFLIFRNISKIILERRQGIFGSRLRTKLVVAFVFFSLAPTLLLFYVSMQFITTSFDTWFSEKVRMSMQKTREAGSRVYKQDQKRLESLARIALQRVFIVEDNTGSIQEEMSIEKGFLEGFAAEYGLSGVSLFDNTGKLVWQESLSIEKLVYPKEQNMLPFWEALYLFLENPKQIAYSKLVSESDQDVLKGFAPIRSPISQDLIGIISTEVRFETQIIKSVESIIEDFYNLKPSAHLIKLSYMILMIVMILLIIFSATWLGFYVAKAIGGPLQNLAEATREIALGNYNIRLMSKSDDETGQLVKAFNHMAMDLREHEIKNYQAQEDLKKTNEELDRRSRYIETVLRSISAGVIATNAKDELTSINVVAEDLLKISASLSVGLSLDKAFSSYLYEKFWLILAADFVNQLSIQKTIELSHAPYEVTLLVRGTKIFDEFGIEVGKVFVFDDAKAQITLQRASAWKEVASRIAHEIKNPITPIKLSAQRLLRKFGDRFSNEDGQVFSDCMETIISQVDSLRDLVNEFSHFSRLPTSTPKKVFLSDIIKDCVKMFKISYPQIEFLEDFETLPEMLLDREQMNRVFVNLITNAITAMGHNNRKVVEISTKLLSELNSVRVELKDNGNGIPKDLKSKVLEPYFSTKDGGTGLGLAIVHQIVTDHRGYLRFADNQPSGTIVIIELPLV